MSGDRPGAVWCCTERDNGSGDVGECVVGGGVSVVKTS